jgi:hypothetical protein
MTTHLGLLVTWAWPALSSPHFWLFLCLIAALAVVTAFLAEWQRRTTLLALVRNAPSGTVLIQERGRGGPGVQLHIGGSADSDQGDSG